MMAFTVTKKHWIAGGVGVVLAVVVALGVWYFVAHRTPSATHFPINPADTISSWTFKVAYDGNATLVAETEADEAKLKSELKKGDYPDYTLYIGIGNDATLLGDGKGAYDAYGEAIALYPNQGLSYLNLAHTMDLMGAYHTAADAYAKAVHVEPGSLTYQTERLNFLVRQFPDDTPAIQAALKDASDQFGDTAAILSIEAQWLEGQGKYAAAVTAWETALKLSPTDRQAAIQAQINRDKAKE